MTTSSEKTIVGCVGCGNMGGAILRGLAERSACGLVGYNKSPERMRPLIAKGVKAMADMTSLVRSSNVIIVAVKPRHVESVLREMLPYLSKDKLVVSVAAGVTLGALLDAVDGVCPVVRAMPNTPALVGAGVFALCFDDPSLLPAHKAFLLELFGRIGTPLEMPEKNMTAFGALVGAGPAYVFHFMDSMLQAGLTLGFSRAEAKRMVQALFEGSVRMAGATDQSFAELKDQVCSPAGITIEAVNHLDRCAVRGDIVDAVLAADKRGREMES